MPLGIQDIKKLFFKDVTDKTIRNPIDPEDHFTVEDLNNFLANADTTADHNDFNLHNVVQGMLTGLTNEDSRVPMSAKLAGAIATHPLADMELFNSLMGFATNYLDDDNKKMVAVSILNNDNQSELKKIDFNPFIDILGNMKLDAEKVNLISTIANGKAGEEQAAIDTAILANAELTKLMSPMALANVAKRTVKSEELSIIAIAAANGKTREEQAAIDTVILSRKEIIREIIEEEREIIEEEREYITLISQMSVEALATIAKRTDKSDELSLLFAVAFGLGGQNQEIIETAILSRDIQLIAQMPFQILVNIAGRTEQSNKLDKLVEIAAAVKTKEEQAAIDTAILADRLSGDFNVIAGMSKASLLAIAERTKDVNILERIIFAVYKKPEKEKAEIYTNIFELRDSNELLESLSSRALGMIADSTNSVSELEKVMLIFKKRRRDEQSDIANVVFNRYAAKPELIADMGNAFLVQLLKFADNSPKLDTIISISKNKSIQEQKGLDMMIYNTDEAIFNGLSKVSLEILATRAVNSAKLDKIVVALKHNGNKDIQESVCKIIFDIATKNNAIIKDMDQKNIIELINYASKEQLAYIVALNSTNSSKYDVEIDKAIISNTQTAAAELVQLAKRSQSEDDLHDIALHANTKGNKEVYKAIISNKFTQTPTLQHLLTNDNGHIEHIDSDSLLDIVLHNNAVADDRMLDQIMLLDRVKDDSRFNKDKIQLFKLHRQKLDLETKEKPDPKTSPVLFSAYHQAQRTIIGVNVFGERAVIASKEQAELIHKHGKTASVAKNIEDAESAEHLMKVGREAHASVLKAKLGVNW